MSSFDANLVPGLQTLPYVHERWHRLLASDAHLPGGPNIGARGHNLTISFLSLNRSTLSVRLVESIRRQLPGFAGELLVIDNGSQPAELDALREGCRQLPFAWRIVELGANYGVAGGRNRTMAHVRTEWVMCLDNDVYFIADPLYAIQQDLALLGCRFLNLPLLDEGGKRVFAHGGHLYVSSDHGGVRCSAGSVFQQQPLAAEHHRGAFLSTFLLGGACVLNKPAFESLGGYDEGMFIGFEDIDFSIRLFQNGYKVGNTSALALVHDHPAPEGPDDEQYERQRFSRERLSRSAEYFEAKHGIHLWSDPVERWLVQRQREMGLVVEPPAPTPSAPQREKVPAVGKDGKRRPRIALVIDSEGWAFWNISQQIQRRLGDKYDFRIIPTTVVDNIVQIFLMCQDCDVVHFFWREYLRLLLAPHWEQYLRLCGDDLPGFMNRYVRPRVVSTCIYDHLHLTPEELQARLPMYHDLANIYYVGSNRLARIYEHAPGYPRPAMVIEDGVDLERFGPRELERFDHMTAREIVVGWVGNSNWGWDGQDYKGTRTLLRPAIEQLRAEGLPIRAQLLDRADSPLVPHEQMPDYYRQIDVYVCMSLIEGTPNPVLESMACGVPVVSTDVGIVPDAFGPLQSQFILPERSIEAVKAALRRLIAERQLFKKLSAENLDRIRAWDWAIKTQRFDAYFQQCLAIPRPKQAKDALASASQP